MTTIIGRKLPDGTLQIAGDKRTTMSNGKYIDDQTKVMRLDNILLGKAGDSLSYKLLNELYVQWKRLRVEKLGDLTNSLGVNTPDVFINSILDSVDFFNYVKDNCNIQYEDGRKAIFSFMILHKDFQILIEGFSAGQVTEMQGEISSIGSGSDIVSTAYKISKEGKIKCDLELEDYYDLINSMDVYTSKEFDTLEMLPEILINNK